MCDMPWKDALLGDLADVNPEALGASPPFRWRFRYIDITSVAHGRVNWLAVPEYEYRSAPSRARRVVRPGDTLFSTVRPGLQAHVCADWDMQEGVICSTGFAVLRPRKLDARFLFHTVFSETVREQVRRREVGSSYPAVSESDLKLVQLTVPESPVEQGRIAEILDLLDAGIQEIESVLAKLKQVKSGLMQSLLTCGLDEEGRIRDPLRNPEQFQSSPLGVVPKCWTISDLGGVLRERPKNGYSPVEAVNFEGGYILGLGCLTVDGFSQCQLKNAPMNDRKLRQYALSPGDLLLSRSNTRDLVAMAGTFWPQPMPCFYPDLMMRLRPLPKLRPRFLEFLLRHSRVRRQLTNRACGTSGSMVKVNAGDVLKTVIAFPQSDEQDAILARLDDVESRISCEEELRSKLTFTKTGLAHDLLAGRIRAKA